MSTLTNPYQILGHLMNDNIVSVAIFGDRDALDLSTTFVVLWLEEKGQPRVNFDYNSPHNEVSFEISTDCLFVLLRDLLDAIKHEGWQVAVDSLPNKYSDIRKQLCYKLLDLVKYR
ncbi:MAG: hypothetical protein AAB657_00870 [Patescibacteria group bacterium]